MSKRNKIITTAGVLVLCASLLVGFSFAMGPGGGGGGAGSGSGVRVTRLERGDLVDSVSATGTIYSQEKTNVYTTLSYPVQKVNVEVGDYVQQGQVLAQLDTSSLQSDIAQQKANLANSQATAELNLEMAQSDLETYLYNNNNDLNTNITNAESAVTTARLDVQSSTSDLKTARKNLSDAEDRGTEDSELNQLKETAVQKEIALQKAQENLDKAEKALEALLASLESEKEAYENKVKSAEITTDTTGTQISIAKLEKDLADATITAPVSGTITAVYANEGTSGAGLMFVIQDTSNLKVVTNIKEYDIASVAVGDRVTIKADATGDTVFSGTLSKISPTSTQTASGDVSSSTDAEYEAEVTVAEGSEGLLVGMNTRLNIIVDEKSNVFSVPYEAVGTNMMGESYILVAEESGGSYIARAYTVTTGLENDLYVEVSSTELSEGMLVIRNVQNAVVDQEVDIQM